MKELLDWIDSYCLEPMLYFHVRSKSVTFELKWQQKKWELRPLEAEHWMSFTAAELLPMLSVLRVDLDGFSASLRDTIISQAIYADLLMERAAALLGKETIDQALVATRKFADQLRAVVDKTLNKPKLRVVHGNDLPSSSSGH